MARITLTLTKGGDVTNDNRPNFTQGGGQGATVTKPSVTAVAADMATLVTDGGYVAAISTTNVAADVATLVADGANPTSGHVSTLSGHWTTLLGQINTASSTAANITTANGHWGTLSSAIGTLAPTAETGDVYLSFDTAKIVTYNDFLAMLTNLARMAAQAGYK